MAGVAHLQAVVTQPREALTAEYRPVALGPKFSITPAGLVVSGDPSWEECATLWEALRTLERSIQFAVGDAVNFFEQRWGERASQLIDATGWSLETLRVYAWVATQVPPANRRTDLSYSHHQAVAALPTREQQHWLRLAAGADGDGPWPVGRLKTAVRDGSDLEPSAWLILVTCASAAEQKKVLKRFELEGLQAKAIGAPSWVRRSTSWTSTSIGSIACRRRPIR